MIGVLKRIIEPNEHLNCVGLTGGLEEFLYFPLLVCHLSDVHSSEGIVVFG